jgi:hypothetical protein
LDVGLWKGKSLATDVSKSSVTDFEGFALLLLEGAVDSCVSLRRCYFPVLMSFLIFVGEPKIMEIFGRRRFFIFFRTVPKIILAIEAP